MTTKALGFKAVTIEEERLYVSSYNALMMTVFTIIANAGAGHRSLFACHCVESSDASAACAPHSICFLITPAANSLRGTRYCEILPATYLAYSQKECRNKTLDVQLTLREVYNKGFNDCPEVSSDIF